MYHFINDKRSIQSSEWIYEALRDLIKEKDYEAISITEIVNRANVGRSTFYRNFDTRDDVLRFKCEQKVKELKEYVLEFGKNCNGTKKPPFIKPFLRFWYLDSTIVELLMAANRLDILADTFNKMFGSFFSSSRFVDEENSKYNDYLLSIRFGIAINLLSQWIKNNKRESPDELADSLFGQLRRNVLNNL